MLRSVDNFGSTLKSNFWRVFDVFLDFDYNAHFSTISLNNSVNIWSSALIQCMFVRFKLLNSFINIICYNFIFLNFLKFCLDINRYVYCACTWTQGSNPGTGTLIFFFFFSFFFLHFVSFLSTFKSSEYLSIFNPPPKEFFHLHFVHSFSAY